MGIPNRLGNGLMGFDIHIMPQLAVRTFVRNNYPKLSIRRLKPRRPGLRPGVGLRRRVRTRPRRRAPGAARPHGARVRARLPTASAGPAAARRPAPTRPDPPAQAGARRSAPPRRAFTRPPANRVGRACGRASACADASGPARAGGRPAQRAPTARVYAPACQPRRQGLRPGVGAGRRIRPRPRRRAPGAPRPHGARVRARLPTAS